MSKYIYINACEYNNFINTKHNYNINCIIKEIVSFIETAKSQKWNIIAFFSTHFEKKDINNDTLLLLSEIYKENKVNVLYNYETIPTINVMEFYAQRNPSLTIHLLSKTPGNCLFKVFSEYQISNGEIFFRNKNNTETHIVLKKKPKVKDIFSFLNNNKYTRNSSIEEIDLHYVLKTLRSLTYSLKTEEIINNKTSYNYPSNDYYKLHSDYTTSVIHNIFSDYFYNMFDCSQEQWAKILLCFKIFLYEIKKDNTGVLISESLLYDYELKQRIEDILNYDIMECFTCDSEFIFSAGEKEYYRCNKLDKPKKCKKCKSIKTSIEKKSKTFSTGYYPRTEGRGFSSN